VFSFWRRFVYIEVDAARPDAEAVVVRLRPTPTGRHGTGLSWTFFGRSSGCSRCRRWSNGAPGVLDELRQVSADAPEKDRVPIRIVVVDDHPLVLRGVESLLEACKDFEVVGSCSTGADAVAAIHRHRPEIVLLDLKLPDKPGLVVLREIQDVEPAPRVVLLTALITEDELIQALRLGVRGVVLKEMAARLLVESIRRVHAGGQWLEKDSAARAIAKLLRREAAARGPTAFLTPREIEIVQLVAAGLSNRQIAERLSIVEGTVKVHLHNIYEKLDVARREELIQYAREHELL
jgi:DNA-binding NarL/FixJ family response regulator